MMKTAEAYSKACDLIDELFAQEYPNAYFESDGLQHILKLRYIAENHPFPNALITEMIARAIENTANEKGN